MGSDDRRPISRVLLVGFMGSGKTTTGRILASRLGWEFADFDELVEARAGLTIPAIFERHGEEGFRRMEEGVGEELLVRARVVLSAGGGWPCRPGRLEKTPTGTFSVWLRVAPEVAVNRVRASAGARPLLEVADPVGRACRLMEDREPYYEKADFHVDVDRRSPLEVVEEILDELDREGRTPEGE